MQVQQDGKSYTTVAYASRSLTPQDRNYSVIELEKLAVVWAMSHYHYYFDPRKRQAVIPQHLRKLVMEKTHSGHFAVNKLHKTLIGTGKRYMPTYKTSVSVCNSFGMWSLE